MNKDTLLGHGLALFTMMVWGMTYISTKVLLQSFSPVEILVIRFIMGFLILWIVYPKRMDHSDKKRELLYLGAGLSGICLYYLLENIALIYTQASNVGVIISVAPFFTAIAAKLVNRSIKLQPLFFVGFVVSMIGISMISFGNNTITFDLRGDLLTLLAATIWAIYSTITNKISTFSLPTVQTTRHVFFYGLLFMIPISFLMGARIHISTIMQPINFFNLLFLGVLASATCFVTWGSAIRRIGTIASGVYIYIVPVITVISSVIILHESLTIFKMIGIILTLAGLILSRTEKKNQNKKAPG